MCTSTCYVVYEKVHFLCTPHGSTDKSLRDFTFKRIYRISASEYPEKKTLRLSVGNGTSSEYPEETELG